MRWLRGKEWENASIFQKVEFSNDECRSELRALAIWIYWIIVKKREDEFDVGTVERVWQMLKWG